jgi:hypothetical protein
MIPTSNDADQSTGTFTTRAEHLDGGIVEDVVNICGFVLMMTNDSCK